VLSFQNAISYNIMRVLDFVSVIAKAVLQTILDRAFYALWRIALIFVLATFPVLWIHFVLGLDPITLSWTQYLSCQFMLHWAVHWLSL